MSKNLTDYYVQDISPTDNNSHDKCASKKVKETHDSTEPMDTEGEYDNTDVIWSQTIFPALDTLNKLTSTPIYQKLAPYTNNDLFGEDPQNLHNIMKNHFEFYALEVKESTAVAIWKQIFIDAIQIIVSNKMAHSKKAHQIRILGI